MGRKCANPCCANTVSHVCYSMCYECYAVANAIRDDPSKYTDASPESIKNRSAFITTKKLVWDKQEENAQKKLASKLESAKKKEEVNLASDEKKKKKEEEMLTKKKEKLAKKKEKELSDTVTYQKKKMQVQKTFLSALDQAIKILMWCEKSDSRKQYENNLVHMMKESMDSVDDKLKLVTKGVGIYSPTFNDINISPSSTSIGSSMKRGSLHIQATTSDIKRMKMSPDDEMLLEDGVISGRKYSAAENPSDKSRGDDDDDDDDEASTASSTFSQFLAKQKEKVPYLPPYKWPSTNVSSTSGGSGNSTPKFQSQYSPPSSNSKKSEARKVPGALVSDSNNVVDLTGLSDDAQ